MRLNIHHTEGVAVSHSGAISGRDFTATVKTLPAHLTHALEDESAIAVHAIWPSLQGQRQNGGETRCFFPVDTPRRGSVVITGRRLRAVNARAPFDHVEVKLQNAPLAEDQFGYGDKCE